LRNLRKRRDGVADRLRVGGVGLHQEHRPLAAHELAVEVFGDGDGEQDLAAR
jgi:hypothetical protein